MHSISYFYFINNVYAFYFIFYGYFLWSLNYRPHRKNMPHSLSCENTENSRLLFLLFFSVPSLLFQEYRRGKVNALMFVPVYEKR